MSVGDLTVHVRARVTMGGRPMPARWRLRCVALVAWVLGVSIGVSADVSASNLGSFVPRRPRVRVRP